MPWWQQILVVAGGGALGSVGRFLTSEGLARAIGKGFPWGTLTVNLVGSFCAGLAFVWLVGHAGAPQWLRLLLMVGVLGGFTTWSSFALETVLLGHNEGAGLALGYLLASLAGGLLLAWLGWRTGLLLRA